MNLLLQPLGIRPAEPTVSVTVRQFTAIQDGPGTHGAAKLERFQTLDGATRGRVGQLHSSRIIRAAFCKQTRSSESYSVSKEDLQ